jgi:hypothetical protein
MSGGRRLPAERLADAHRYVDRISRQRGDALDG